MDNIADFDDFEVSSRANYRKEPVEKIKTPKVKAYNVKVNFKKQKIRFDKEIAAEIDLAHNSLAHAVSKNKDKIAIIVAPGDQGKFAKGLKGREKSNVFKNRKLVEDLVSMGMTSGTYMMTSIGYNSATIGKKEVPGCQWFALTMVGEPKDLNAAEADKDENFLIENEVESETGDDI